MSRFLVPALGGLAPYVPGEQPQNREYVKLNTNESPFPPSPKVLAALNGDEAAKLNLYSDPTILPLKQAVAQTYGVEKGQVFVGNGSDEVLGFAFLAFADGEHPVRMPDISYGLYSIFARLFRAEADIVPLNDDLTLPVESFCHAGKMVALANPNAPTGIALSLSDIERIVSTNREQVVLVDEAYVDFGGETALPLINKYDNLLVVRTFSKSRSLAGARIGYAMASEGLIEDMERVRNSFHPYNVNRLSMLAGVRAMEDAAYFEGCRRRIIAQREETAGELKALGFYMTDSRANFLFVKHPALTGSEYYTRLKEKGVLVRYFDAPRLKAYVRVTVGSEAQMALLVEKTKEILREVRA